MTLARDLLEQATHLSLPKKTSHKQSIVPLSLKKNYYAVFHLLNSEAVDLIAPNLSPARKTGVQRWFSHTETKKVCQIFLSNDFPRPASLTCFKITPTLEIVARIFIRLQAARHRADYDLSDKWTRFSAQQQIGLAQDVFAAWKKLQRHGGSQHLHPGSPALEELRSRTLV